MHTIFTKIYPSVSGTPEIITKYIGKIISGDVTKTYQISEGTIIHSNEIFCSEYSLPQIRGFILLADRLVNENGKFVKKSRLQMLLDNEAFLHKVPEEPSFCNLWDPVPIIPTCGEKLIIDKIQQLEKEIQVNKNTVNKAVSIIDARRSETEIMIKSLDPYFKKLEELEPKLKCFKQDLIILQTNQKIKKL